jgi:hypothetical protein
MLNFMKMGLFPALESTAGNLAGVFGVYGYRVNRGLWFGPERTTMVQFWAKPDGRKTPIMELRP